MPGVSVKLNSEMRSDINLNLLRHARLSREGNKRIHAACCLPGRPQSLLSLEDWFEAVRLAEMQSSAVTPPL
jgi:hypothetical protein